MGVGPFWRFKGLRAWGRKVHGLWCLGLNSLGLSVVYWGFGVLDLGAGSFEAWAWLIGYNASLFSNPAI